jgi:hypothetical protein
MSFIRRLHRVVRLDILGAVTCGILLFSIGLGGRRPEQQNIAFRHALLQERMQSQTVIVKTDHGEGSGVVVKRGDKTFVWTAGHVVKGVSEVKVGQVYRYHGKQAGSQTIPAHVIARLENTDAALLWVDAPPDKLTGAEWATETPGPGEKVWHCGNLLGANFDGSISEGVVSQVGVRPTAELGDWPWGVVDDCTVNAMPGSSGGPVFNSAGEVVGLVVGGVPGIPCYVPMREIFHGAIAQKIAWAVYGRGCPTDQQLQQAAADATMPDGLSGLLKIILGGVPAPVPETPAPAPEQPTKVAPKKAPKVVSPKSR